MQRLVDALGVLVVTAIDLSQLALVAHQQLLGLRLPLLYVIVPIFLDLLEQSVDRGFLLLLQAFQSQLHCLLISHLFLPELSGFGFLDLLLDRACLFVFLQLH